MIMVLTNDMQSLKDNCFDGFTICSSPYRRWSILGKEESLVYHPRVEFDEAFFGINDEGTMGVHESEKAREETLYLQMQARRWPA
jgi:hypothetical protein